VNHSHFETGIELFNSAQFFAAHEVWEDVWRAEVSGFRKKFLQGLIQIAVGLHHHSTGNLVGAASLLTRASRNLAAYPPDFAGIDLESLLEQVRDCRRAFATSAPISVLPTVRPCKPSQNNDVSIAKS